MFVVHVGLHKTATTSLQKDIYPFINEYKFIGRRVSRLEDQDELYLKIAKFCFSREYLGSSCEAELNSLIGENLEKNHLLMSDEWLTADYSALFGLKGATWQEKIDRLSRLLAGVDHKVLVSLRNPIDGIFSQYCEFTTVGVDDAYPSFEEYVLRSNDSAAYHYPDLDAFLKEKFNFVDYITFDDIRSDDDLSKLKSLLGTKSMPKLGHHNQKTKSKIGVQVEAHNRLIVNLLKITPRPLKTILKKVSLIVFLRNSVVDFFSYEKYIPYPSDEFKWQLERRFRASFDFLNNLSDS